MKKLLLFIILIPLIGFTQNLPLNANGKVMLEGKINCSSKDGYLKLLEWSATIKNYFPDMESDIITEDKKSGLVIFKQKMFVPDYDNIKYISVFANYILTLNITETNVTYKLTSINLDYAYKQYEDLKGNLPIESFLTGKDEDAIAKKSLLKIFVEKENKLIASIDNVLSE